jgi:Holliday junction resolvase RusA-like endonuclease
MRRNILSLDRVRVERRAITANSVIVLDLPMPPGVNHLYPTVGNKRIRSSEYDEWTQRAGWELQIQRPGCAVGPVEITVTLNDAPRKYDPDGKLKALLDLIVSHGIIADDNHQIVRDLRVKIGDVAGARVEIRRAA